MKKTVLLIGNYYKDFLRKFNHDSLKNFTIILSKSNPKDVNDSLKIVGIKTITISNHDELCNNIRIINPEIIISIGWRKILRKDFFELFKNKILVNIHPAILPDYKGYHTEPYVIFNNEQFHGITAHELIFDLDAGKIILQEKFPISEISTVKSIKYEVQQKYPKFFKKLLDILNTDNIIYKPQSGKTKIIATKRTPDDSKIDPSHSLKSLYNIIRAFDPEKYPAFFYINKEKIFIKLWTENMSKKKYEL